jgi:hypothetical protein
MAKKPTGIPIEPIKIGPSQGPVHENVTIEGDHFHRGCKVRFDVNWADNVSFQGPRRLLAQAPTPAHSDDPVRVVVRNPDGGESQPDPDGQDLFQYTTPDDGDDAAANGYGGATVTGLHPTFGSPAGGKNVRIDGTGFPNPPKVYFGYTQATNNVVYHSDTLITADSPGGQPGQVEVTVTDANNTPPVHNQPWDLFTYASVPTVTGVSPASGPSAGGTVVTITGTNFTNVASVLFGGTAATNFNVLNATTIDAQAPQEVAGAVDVRVSNPAGTSRINRPGDVFTYS